MPTTEETERKVLSLRMLHKIMKIQTKPWMIWSRVWRPSYQSSAGLACWRLGCSWRLRQPRSEAPACTSSGCPVSGRHKETAWRQRLPILSKLWFSQVHTASDMNKGSTGSSEHQSKSTTSGSGWRSFRAVQVFLVSTAPAQVRPTKKDSTTTTTCRLHLSTDSSCHRFFRNIISLTDSKFSQWDVGSSCVSIATWDYPLVLTEKTRRRRL